MWHKKALFYLWPSNVLLPEEKLSIQVADVDGVHVDQVNVLEAHEGQVLQKLASQTSGPDDKDLAWLPQEVKHLRRRLEVGMSEGTFQMYQFNIVMINPKS